MYRLSPQFKSLYLAIYAISIIVSIGLFMHFFTPGCVVFPIFFFGIVQLERHRRALEEEMIVVTDQTLK
jgi:hypothetical protein